MILGRVAKRARAQDWFAVALELLIVIIGVFIAIEVANWNAARQDRQEERRYYGQLLVDLRGDVATLSEAKRRADFHDRSAELVLARLAGESPPEAAGRMAKAIHQAGFIYIPQASRGTYDELVSTGNLRLLRNSRLKSRIANYYGDFQNSRQWDSLLRDQQSDYWTATAGILPRPVLRAALRGGEPALSAEQDRAVWAAARSNPRLPAMLIGMAAHQERVRRDSELLTVKAKILIAEIERHLQSG